MDLCGGLCLNKTNHTNSLFHIPPTLSTWLPPSSPSSSCPNSTCSPPPTQHPSTSAPSSCLKWTSHPLPASSLVVPLEPRRHGHPELPRPGVPGRASLRPFHPSIHLLPRPEPLALIHPHKRRQKRHQHQPPPHQRQLTRLRPHMRPVRRRTQGRRMPHTGRQEEGHEEGAGGVEEHAGHV